MKLIFSILLILFSIPCISSGQERLKPVLERSQSNFLKTVIYDYAYKPEVREHYSCIVTSACSPHFALLVFDDYLEVIWETTEENDRFDYGDIICFHLTVNRELCNELKKMFNAAILSAEQPEQTERYDGNISYELINPMGLAAKCNHDLITDSSQLGDVLGAVILAVMNNDKKSAVAQTENVRMLTKTFNSMDWTHEYSNRYVYVSFPSFDGFFYTMDVVDNSVKRKKILSIEDLFKIENINSVFYGDPLDAFFTEFVKCE